MTLVVFLSIATLTVVNWTIFRSFMAPAVLFSGYWSGILLLILLAEDRFYPLSPLSLLVFACGVATFSIGSWLALGSGDARKRSMEPQLVAASPAVDRLLWGALFLTLLALPLYARALLDLSAASGVSDFWIGLRYQTSVITAGRGLGLWEYYVNIVTVLSLISLSATITKMQRFRFALFVTLALGVNLATASRIGALLTIFALLGVSWLKAGSVRLRSTIITGTTAVTVFGAVGYLLGKGIEQGLTLAETVRSVIESAQLYLLGGPVALDQYLQGNAPQSPGIRTFRFFALIGERILSVPIEVPPLVLAYADTPNRTNVYTMFFPYISDFGLLGVALIPLVLGSFFTIIYNRARGGSYVAILFYGYFVGATAVSNANETFFISFSVWFQILLIGLLFHHVASLDSTDKRSDHSAITSTTTWPNASPVERRPGSS